MADIVFTVSQINEYINRKMFSDPFLSRIKVVGEVTNLKHSAVGHAFFSLKDEDALIGCILYDYEEHEDRHVIEDGALLEISGRISFYRKSASVQLVVQSAAPHGIGDLFARLERTKKKLLLDGVFDEAYKKPLPFLALRIGVVTSLSGAVLHDITSVATRRFDGIQIKVYPVPVQGIGAAAEICRGITYFNEHDEADVIIVARGGGSFEDLSAFNEESVARSVFASDVPVVSAVGHETDYTLCDLAADLRAPTPSAAAELVVRSKSEVADMLASYKKGLHDALADLAKALDARLKSHKSIIENYPLLLKLSHAQTHIEANKTLIRSSVIGMLRQHEMQLEKYKELMESLNPRGVLSRGYAIVHDDNGSVIETAKKAAGRMEIEFYDGRIAVEERSQSRG